MANNRVNMTNIDFGVIDGADLGRRLVLTDLSGGPAPVHLINDFEAIGYGLLTLDTETEVFELQPGLSATAVEAPRTLGVLGAGTGLGACFLTWEAAAGGGGRYRVWPTEGGHSDWAPRTDLEAELHRWLRRRYGQRHRVSVERLVSGPGLAAVYEFLCEVFPEATNATQLREFGAGLSIGLAPTLWGWPVWG